MLRFLIQSSFWEKLDWQVFFQRGDSKIIKYLPNLFSKTKDYFSKIEVMVLLIYFQAQTYLKVAQSIF